LLLPSLENETDATSDVWQLPADGTGSPTVLIPQAMSPAVVRMSPAVVPR
jgi:hypothetical protein